MSWSYCEKHKIDIPNPGGGNLSRNLDEMRNLQDYVRLSFTTEHPMMYVAMKDGRISNPVILRIDPSVVYLQHTMYADMNATTTKRTPNIGKSLEDFKKIHFSTVKAHKHFDLDENERPYFQAEVMVMTFIPKTVSMNHLTSRYITDRFDPSMRMHWKSCCIIVGINAIKRIKH